MKPIPVYAAAVDWPRKVRDATNDLDGRVKTLEAAGSGESIVTELDGGDASSSGTAGIEIDGGSA